MISIKASMHVLIHVTITAPQATSKLERANAKSGAAARSAPPLVGIPHPRGVCMASHKLLAEHLRGPDGDDSRARDEAATDRFGLAYMIMMLLGVGSLLPWNALITPIEYLKLRIAGSAFESSFESMFSTMFTSVSFLSLLAMQALQHHLSLQVRIIGSLLLLLLVFGLLTALAIAPLAVSEDVLLDRLREEAAGQFTVLMLCGALCGLGQAFLSGSAMAYASIFAQPKYLQAVSGGQGLAGLSVTVGSLLISLPGITRVCSSGAPPALDSYANAAGSPLLLHSSSSASGFSASHARDVVAAAAVYFGAACAITITCIAAFLFIERLPFTRARKRLLRDESANSSTPLAGGSSGSDGQSVVVPLDATAAASAGSSSMEPSQGPSPVNIEAAQATHDVADDDISTVRLLADLWDWSISISLVYIVTIAIFPALTSTIMAVPSANGTGVHGQAGHCEWSHMFGPIGFVVFNLGDTIGRNLPCVLRGPRVILFIACARVAFAPLFMLCYTAAGGALQLPLFAGDDALALVIMAVFSTTNGWLTSSVFVSSQGVIAPHRRNIAASLLVCMLNAGIAVGAALSFVVRYLDCTPSAANDFSCNPFVTPTLNVSKSPTR